MIRKLRASLRSISLDLAYMVQNVCRIWRKPEPPQPWTQEDLDELKRMKPFEY